VMRRTKARRPQNEVCFHRIFLSRACGEVFGGTGAE
jgi:hypothetical protein